jgi:2-keto-3-deoxy-L-rhamnonate aldolase RhmA
MEHLGTSAWRLAGEGPTLFGTWAKIPALETAEMLVHGGFDVVVVDMEHAVCGDAIAVADVRG